MRHDKAHRSKIIAAVSLAALVLLAACNTTAGAGKDISKAGHAITNGAEDNGATE
jgi:predicted small secreted protein